MMINSGKYSQQVFRKIENIKNQEIMQTDDFVMKLMKTKHDKPKR